MSNNDKGATPRADARMFTLSIYMGEEFEGYKVVPWADARDLERELEASQARAARLEEALKELVSQINEFANKWGEADFYTGDAIKALSDSPNWLQERLKAEGERCAKTIEERFGGEAWITYARASEAGAATIRALPEGE